LLSVILLMILSACVSSKQGIVLKKQLEIKQIESITELTTIPQDVNFYTRNITASSSISSVEFEKKYFRVWNIDKCSISVNDATWAHRVYTPKNSYGENLQHYKQSFFNLLLDNSNYDNFCTFNKRAISLKTLDIRAMPSDKPIFMDPNKAGEGFPFDYLQNSSISANKPLFISHYSKDKKWVFVESSFTYGWIKSKNIVLLEKEYTSLWQKAKQVFITKDGESIFGENNFLFTSRIGMMLPLIKEHKNSYTVLTVSKYKNTQALYVKSRLSKRIAHKGFLEFTNTNINNIMTQLSVGKYGWGGMYQDRDCSSTLRDFYLPFGLWLPRNSYQQSSVGQVLDVEKLSKEEKIISIKKNAIPFRTLLYKQGHIGLYVGTFENEIIMYQNVWGVKTMKNGIEGRFIVGRPVFSSLEIGSNLENFDANATMLAHLKSITKL